MESRKSTYRWLFDITAKEAESDNVQDIFESNFQHIQNEFGAEVIEARMNYDTLCLLLKESSDNDWTTSVASGDAWFRGALVISGKIPENKVLFEW